MRSPRVILVLFLLVLGGAIAGYNWWLENHLLQLAQECETALEAEDWSSLEASASKWILSDPENGDAWLFLSTASVEQEDFERAVECLNRLPDDHPKAVLALLQRVEILFSQLNRPVDAVETCERILQIEPRATAPYQRLIYYYAITLQPQKMLRWIHLAIDRGREPPEAYPYLVLASELRFSNGEYITGKWLKEYPDDEGLLVAHVIYQARRDASGVIREAGYSKINAEEEFEACRSRFPSNLELLAFDLKIATEAGNVDSVTELLSRIPEAEVDSRILRYQGWLYAAEQELELALQSYMAAIKADPFDWRARHGLTNVLRKLGKADELKKQTPIVASGKKLEATILGIVNPREISAADLTKIANYASACGANDIASSISRRVPDGSAGAATSSSNDLQSRN